MHDNHALIIRAKNGDKLARTHVVEQHIRLVHKIVRRFKLRHHSYEDLIQEGVCGLFDAMNRFDPSRNVKFSTYAFPWIKSYVFAAVTQNISKDNKTKKIYWHRYKAYKALWDENQTEPTDSDLAQKLGVKIEYISNMQASLMPTMEYNDELVSDEKSNAEIQLLKNVNKTEIQKALSKLSEREQFVIHARFLSEDICTLDTVGKNIGCSRERARQIESEALKKLKKILSKMPDVDQE